VPLRNFQTALYTNSRRFGKRFQTFQVVSPADFQEPRL